MDKYEKIGLAGEGAYGVVLKCRHNETGEIVAIKKFREPDDDDEEARRLAQREIDILRSVKHDNIIQLREAFRRKGILYLVFEYVEQCLMDVLESHPKGLGVDTTRKLTCQLLRALAYCHRHGVIHRDVKPENLLMDPANNCLRLCDFGSACKAARNAVLTDYVATRWYRAPELLVRSNDYTTAVDIWGVGCVKVELAIGEPLFAGETDIDQLCIIHRAVGPLTAKQMEMRLELSGCGEAKLPCVSEARALKKRFRASMEETQIHFLESLVVVDPSRRLTAERALASPWLEGVQLPAASRPQSRPCSAARPGSGDIGRPPRHHPHQSAPPSTPSTQVKPRLRRGVSPFDAHVQRGGHGISAERPPAAAGINASPRDHRAVGIVADRRPLSELSPRQPDLESIPSCIEGSGVQQRSTHMTSGDLCEESISEEISENSGREDSCIDSSESHPVVGSKAKAAGQAAPAMPCQQTSTDSHACRIQDTSSGHDVVLDATGLSSVREQLERSASATGADLESTSLRAPHAVAQSVVGIAVPHAMDQRGGDIAHSAAARAQELGSQPSSSSFKESPREDYRGSRKGHPDPVEESVLEEIEEDEHEISEHVLDVKVQSYLPIELACSPSNAPIGARGSPSVPRPSSRPSSRVKRCVRPASGQSVRSASLTHIGV